MCGIGGVSLVENSTVNMRALGAALLAELTYRGHMASGYAYYDKDGAVQYHKDAVRGNQLKMRGLPRDAKTGIFHTRYATKGKVGDNWNNHPVLSPDENIALVHNGVISNDYAVRQTFEKEMQDIMPPVDTAVIPALLQEGGYERFAELSGDAAVSWLDNSTPGVMHLAKISHSPVVATYLEDGSLVFASTELLLRAALRRANLKHGFVGALDDGEYVQIIGGHIDKVIELPESKYRFNWNDAATWRDATSGGHGTTTTEKYPKYESPVKTKALQVYGVGSEFDGTDATGSGGFGNGWDNAWDDDEAWDAEEIPPARFYTVDHDGDYKEYTTLDKMLAEINWYAGLNMEGRFASTPELRWIEWFSDLGEILNDDYPREAISWVDEPDLTIEHENQDAGHLDLGYIRDGANMLGQMVGA